MVGAGSSPTLVILIMFLCILLGIGARYIFYLQRNFSWLDFAKPLCISPILLLPLIGSLPGREKSRSHSSGVVCIARLSERLLLAGGLGRGSPKDSRRGSSNEVSGYSLIGIVVLQVLHRSME